MLKGSYLMSKHENILYVEWSLEADNFISDYWFFRVENVGFHVYADWSSLMIMQMEKQGRGKRRMEKKKRGMDGWKRLRCQRTQRWIGLSTWVHRLSTLVASFLICTLKTYICLSLSLSLLWVLWVENLRMLKGRTLFFYYYFFFYWVYNVLWFPSINSEWLWEKSTVMQELVWWVLPAYITFGSAGLEGWQKWFSFFFFQS